jgi:hypothetical protein
MIGGVFNKEVFVLLWSVIFAVTGRFTSEIPATGGGESGLNNDE